MEWGKNVIDNEAAHATDAYPAFVDEASYLSKTSYSRMHISAWNFRDVKFGASPPWNLAPSRITAPPNAEHESSWRRGKRWEKLTRSLLDKNTFEHFDYFADSCHLPPDFPSRLSQNYFVLKFASLSDLFFLRFSDWKLKIYTKQTDAFSLFCRCVCFLISVRNEKNHS